MVDLGAFATSDTIGAAVIKALQSASLGVEKLIAIGVDGYNGRANHCVSTYFKALVPEIFIFKCVSHSLQLVANKATNSLPAHIDFLARESYNWFSHCTQRLLHFQELHETTKNEVPKKLLQRDG